MSYILEALADSEQARREIAVLPKYSLLPAVGEDRSRLRHWPYLLAAALVLNAAVIPLWLRSSSHAELAPVSEPPAPQAVSRPMAATVPNMASSAGGDAQVQKAAAATPEKSTAVTDNETPANAAFRGLPQARQPRHYAAYDRPVARPPRTAAATPRKTEPRPANAVMPTPLPKVLPKAVPKVVPKAMATRTVAAASAAPAPVATPAPRAQAVVAQAAPAAAVATGAAGGLPPDLQREIPALSVAGFIRDDTSSGMVIVNDRLLREGDEVAPGLRLEKILHDSLLFNYKGYRFKR